MKIEFYKNGEPLEPEIKWTMPMPPSAGDYIVVGPGGTQQFIVTNVAYCLHIDTIQVEIVHTYARLEEYARLRTKQFKQDCPEV